MEEQIRRFLAVSSGPGSGNNYGNDDGFGFGSSSGFGYNCGCGFGCGYSDGDGYGNGNDYGGGIKSIDSIEVYRINRVSTVIYSVHGNYARGAMLNKDLTFTPCYIAKVGNCFAHGDTLHKAMADAQEKWLNRMPASEKIKTFKEEFPTLEDTATGRIFYDWHHRLTGSCAAGRDHFCRNHDVDLDKEYTVDYFLNLVKDDFGGDVIREVMTEYE